MSIDSERYDDPVCENCGNDTEIVDAYQTCENCSECLCPLCFGSPQDDMLIGLGWCQWCLGGDW